MLLVAEFVVEGFIAIIAVVIGYHTFKEVDKIGDEAFKLNDVRNSFNEEVRFH